MPPFNDDDVIEQVLDNLVAAFGEQPSPTRLVNRPGRPWMTEVQAAALDALERGENDAYVSGLPRVSGVLAGIWNDQIESPQHKREPVLVGQPRRRVIVAEE